MARKHDTKAVREAVGALDDLEVPVPEIHRRLREDECGIGYQVDISKRAVYLHRTNYREQKARASTALDTVAESVAATKQRAVELLRRELLALEQKRAGTITAVRVASVERIYKALDRMGRVERAEGIRRPKPAQTNGNGGEPEKPESALERLAREQREAVAEQTDDNAA